MKTARALLFALGAAAGLGTLHADVIVALEASGQSAAAGSRAVFSGTLTNTSTSGKVFLNEVAVTLPGASATALELKANAFYANVPGILLPGETYAGPLFQIAVGAGAPPAGYSGSVVFQGGTDIFAADSLAGAGFTVTVLLGRHSADTSGDFRVGLVELTRVIELYNTRNGTTRTGCYKVDATGEDGFAPDPTRPNSAVVTLPFYHSADSNRDGKLSLLELTRVIELYNYRAGTTRTGQYHVQAGTEDGFAPGP